MTSQQDLRESLLVLRAQAGDQLAFHELVRTYSPRLRYYLLGLMSGGSVDDVLQDVWLTVYRKLTTLRSSGAWRAWLYRIARNRAYRELRIPMTRSLPTDLDVPDERQQIDQWKADDAERIHQAMQQLSNEHRDVLLLRFMESMSYEEISQVLGCSIGTIRSRIHYAKTMLKTKLEKDDD